MVKTAHRQLHQVEPTFLAAVETFHSTHGFRIAVKRLGSRCGIEGIPLERVVPRDTEWRQRGTALRVAMGGIPPS
jgi:hypothetical protein